MGSRRLFVSVDLPHTLVDAFGAVQAPFCELDGVRPIDPTQAHVTVKFLGDVPDELVDDVIDTLEGAVDGIDPFPATLGGLGVFPSLEYISIIWLGVREGATELTAIHDAVEAAFVDAGYDPADHEFTPHLTLARMDHAGAKERVQELVSASDPTVGEMTVSEVRLTESILRSSGPVYETIHEATLHAGPAGR